VTLRPLVELSDADRVREVIDRVWGEQALPREMLRAFQHAGAVLWGAESGGGLVGFVLGFAGLDEGLHLHSHMLATLPDWQSRGVGFALKLAQRAVCLDEGIDEVRWTYDPLVGRNAHFNLVKLRAVATRWLPDFYGEMTDRLNRGDRSDRFEVRWRIGSDRVEQVLATGPPGDELSRPRGAPVLLEPTGDPASPQPRITGEEPRDRAVVAIPSDQLALRGRDPRMAARWREASASAFAACFEAGLEATGFCADGSYLFERPRPRPRE
jgi:predicted GNAT superfamily acetyltransferase